MRQLFPEFLDEINPELVYAAGERTGPRWLLVNMISTIDGAIAIDGKSGGLGGPADKRVFAAIRALADVILVGAGTVRAENYGPPGSGARLAIVTASLDLAPDARVFTGDSRPIVFTTSDADPERCADLEPVADVVAVNSGVRVDLAAAVATLEGIIVCEGGPSINGQLVAEDLVDEMCLSVAPLLAAGGSPRAAHGPGVNEPRRMRVAHVLEEDGVLFLRYVRSR